MFRRLPARSGFGLALLSLLLPGAVAELAAQRPEMIRLQGKVKSADKLAFTMEGKDGSDVVVKVAKNSRVSVEGTASVEYLEPHINVEFVADVTKAGLVPEPLSEITVCTFTEGAQPTFSPDDPTKPTRKGKDAVNKYLVRGTIKFNVKGKLTIVAGDKTVKATLAPDAKVKVKVSEVSWAQPGDAASVQGMERVPGEIFARTIKITLAKPLEPKNEGPTRKKTAGR